MLRKILAGFVLTTALLFSIPAMPNVEMVVAENYNEYYLVNTLPDRPAMCRVSSDGGFYVEFWLYPNHRSQWFPFNTSWRCFYY